MTALEDDRAYTLWVGRKATSLRRPTLDCGHPNIGEVYFHALCDRLSCSDGCAKAEHDCGVYAGVKSGTDEEVEPDEAAPPPPATWTTNHDPRSIGCRNCGSWLVRDVVLCGSCSALPSCSATRWAAVWGGTARCLLPYGHADPEHWSVEGRAWTDRVYVAPPPVESLRPGGRPFLMPAIDAERDRLAAALTEALTSIGPHVEAALAEIESAPAPRLPWWNWKRWTR